MIVPDWALLETDNCPASAAPMAPVISMSAAQPPMKMLLILSSRLVHPTEAIWGVLARLPEPQVNRSFRNEKISVAFLRPAAAPRSGSTDREPAGAAQGQRLRTSDG